MHVNRILKGYFAFLMVLTTMGAVNSSEQAMNYLASVVNAFESRPNETLVQKDAIAALSERVQGNFGENAAIELTNKIEEAYANIGAIGVKLSDFKIKNFNIGSELNEVQIKIVGVEGNKILRLQFYDGEKLLAAAEKRGEIFVFENLQISPGNSEKTYAIKADLSPELHSGDRFRIDLISPFEVKGPYMTLIGAQKEPKTLDSPVSPR